MASEMTGARKLHWSPTRLMLLQPDIQLLRKRVNLLKEAKTKTGCFSPVLSYGPPGGNDENNALVLFNPFPGDWFEYFRVSTSFFASTKRMVLFLICFSWNSLCFASANQSNVMGQSKQVEDGRED